MISGDLEAICSRIGDGDCVKGCALIFDLLDRMKHARAKHHVFAKGLASAVGVVGAEFRELELAMGEGLERVRDEALDVAVTALRLYAGEWKE